MTSNVTGPYFGSPQSSWLSITRQLVNKHPLQPVVLREAATTSWAMLWKTTVGTGPVSVKLSALKVPATIIGYFFEVLLANELQRRDPTLWRGTQSKDEKDLVYLPNRTAVLAKRLKMN